MAAALSRVLTLPVVEIITSFMELAPGGPDSDEILTLLMLQIRKNTVDEDANYDDAESYEIRVGEKYMFRLDVQTPKNADESDEDEDEDNHLSYAWEGNVLDGCLVKQQEGDLDPHRPWSHWVVIGESVNRPATPQGFREMRIELLDRLKCAERDGLCPKARGRQFCNPDMQTVRFVRVPGAQYCTRCCLHLAFQGAVP